MEWLLFLIPVLLVAGLAILLLRAPRGRINQRRGANADSTGSSGDSGSYPLSSGRHDNHDGDGNSASDGGGDSGGGDGGGGGD